MKNKIIASILVGLLFTVPVGALALSMPQSGNELAAQSGINSEAYVLVDAESGQVLASNNSGKMWPPASLTKLITALVVLESKPNLNKQVAMSAADQSAGGCKVGGACLSTKAGVKYKLRDLLYAALVSSYNNAANAVSRSLGLTPEKFTEKMNQKAADLGAVNTKFFEPTGMNPENYTTAEDYAKVAAAAFANPTLLKMAQATSYSFASTNSKYKHSIKTTNKLLDVPGFSMIAGKTGYLDESKYNFASLAKDNSDRKVVVVVLGSPTYAGIFADTKILAGLAEDAKFLANNNQTGAVLGLSTQTGQ